jgi:hypothetical protein
MTEQVDTYPYEEQRRYREQGQQPYHHCRMLDGHHQPTGPLLEFISYPWGEEDKGDNSYTLLINIRNLRPDGQGDPMTLQTVRCDQVTPWNPQMLSDEAWAAFGRDSTAPCVACGEVGRNKIELHHGYTICRLHAHVPPAEVQQRIKASQEAGREANLDLDDTSPGGAVDEDWLQ